MDTYEFWKDFQSWRAKKKEPEETAEPSNYFDENQENADPQKYYYKEELDLKWDEKDNKYNVICVTFGHEDTDKSTKESRQNNKSISIRPEREGILKIENSDTQKDKSPYFEKHIYKEELNLAWDEKDNDNYDVNHSIAKETVKHFEKNKSSSISRKRKSQLKITKEKIGNPDTKKECPKCKKSLKNLNTLKKHLYYCGKVPHMQCDSCPYKAKYKNALITHIVRNHPQQISIVKRKAGQKRGNANSKACKESELHDKCFRYCMNCNVNTDNPKLSQCNKCASELLYQCRKCNKLFPTREILAHHTIRRCDPKGYFHCPACVNFKSTSKKDVRVHMKVHLKPGLHLNVEDIKWKKVEGRNDIPNSQLFICPSCNKQFHRQASLSSHMRYCIRSQGVSKPPTHYVEKKKYPDHKYMITTYCQTCNTTYVRERGKNAKYKCCGTRMSFVCLKCKKRYENYVSAYNHVANRCNLETKIKCNKCDYEGSKLYVIRHMKVKHEFQSAECPKCKKLLKNKEILKQHEGFCRRKPLECEHCPYTSKRKHQLKLHIFKIHMN